MDRIRAPYSFVPLNQSVYKPGNDPALDVPFQDGLCGTLEVEIEAHTPIFVRGTPQEKDKPSTFFKTPDNEFAIPGSSLRGALRNVIEIATFGEFWSRINDHKYGVRDLNNRKLYGDHMARIVNGEPTPMVNAGWFYPLLDGETPELKPNPLDPEQEQIGWIHVCDFAKIEYDEIEKLAEAYRIVRGPTGFDPRRKQSAKDKYDRWRDAEGKTSRIVKVGVKRSRPADGRQLLSDYGVVSGPGAHSGRLVFTGQPSQHIKGAPKGKGAGNPKHHDFVFFNTRNHRIPVSRRQFQDFCFIHANRGQQNRRGESETPNTEWGFWKERAWDKFVTTPAEKRKPELGVPVFFLAESAKALRAFGLAMMFRLAYHHSTKSAAKRFQERLDGRDFADQLFGWAPQHGVKGGLRGRVTIGLARAINAQEAPEVSVVLGAPKASYYPNYVEQGAQPGASPTRVVAKNGRESFEYKTWMDTDARPRGWKRYRPIEGGPTTPPAPKKGDGSAMDTTKVASRFKPLKKGAKFRTRIRVHNLRPHELGALLWALDFGGSAGTFHMLGMGRPLGYGQCALKLVSLDVEDMKGKAHNLTDADTFRERFVQHMNDLKVGSFKEQTRELIAAARPLERGLARHMMIDHPDFRNEFQKAKLLGFALRTPSQDSK
jgi:CRISPR-associated protein (TIGR03986 family)